MTGPSVVWLGQERVNRLGGEWSFLSIGSLKAAMAFPIDIMSRGFSHVRLCPRPCSRRAPACIDGGPPGRDAVETACGLVDQLRVLQIVNVGAFDYQKSDMLRYLDIPVVDRSAPDEIFLPPASTFLSPSCHLPATFLHLPPPPGTFHHFSWHHTRLCDVFVQRAWEPCVGPGMSCSMHVA